MNKLALENYNLETTLLGGQAFNWDYFDEAYYGFTKDQVVKIVPKGTQILWQTYPENDNIDFLLNYLALDHNYDQMLQNILKDEYINNAIKDIPAVRILNQDFEQTLLSFILSSHKSIKGVRKAVRELSNRYGDKLVVDGKEFSLFPRAETLAELSEEELRGCGLGFRTSYLKNAAAFLAANPNQLNTQNETQARETLTSLKGVGDKIADCVMVFSLGFRTITPLDVWAKRVLIDLYKVDPKLNYSQMREWYKNYFGEYTAWAGQFLFEYYRKTYKKNLTNLK